MNWSKDRAQSHLYVPSYYYGPAIRAHEHQRCTVAWKVVEGPTRRRIILRPIDTIVAPSPVCDLAMSGYTHSTKGQATAGHRR